MSGQNRHSFRWSAAFLVAASLFVVAQILAVSHAAKYGDGPHDHGGQPCVIALAAPGAEKAVSTAAIVFAAAVLGWRIALFTPVVSALPAPVHSARPRGPPAH